MNDHSEYLKGILVNPKNKLITSVDIPSDTIDMNVHITGLKKATNSRFIDIIQLRLEGSNIAIIVDYEGMITGKPIYTFAISGFDSIIAGNAVVLGIDGECMCDAPIGILTLSKNIEFISELQLLIYTKLHIKTWKV